MHRDFHFKCTKTHPNGILIEETHSAVNAVACAPLHSFDSIADVIGKVSTRFRLPEHHQAERRRWNSDVCIALKARNLSSKLSSSKQLFAFISRASSIVAVLRSRNLCQQFSVSLFSFFSTLCSCGYLDACFRSSDLASNRSMAKLKYNVMIKPNLKSSRIGKSI